MFTKALSFIKSILGSAGLVAPILAACGVTVPTLIPTLIPMIISLMTSAEEALGDGTGPLKKVAVTAGAVAFVDNMKELSTGGQKETWSTITPDVVGVLVDSIATVANAVGETTGGGMVFDDTEWERVKADRGR
jgi:hypothetical protein